MDVQIERATFIGHGGPDEIVFACVNGGRYAILRNGVPVGVWGRADYAYCLGIYLRQITRSTDQASATQASATQASAAATFYRPRPLSKPGSASSISAKAS